MAFLARKTLFRNKWANVFITQNIEKLFKTPTILVGNQREKRSGNLLGNASLLDVYGRRRRESHREKWRCKFPYIFSMFSAIYTCTCERVECMDNDESSSLMSATGVGETPHKNHNIRNLNGRFAKLRNVGHKEKSIEPMKAALAARRSLVFDECDENEPPSKRKTRSEKVHTIQLVLYKIIHLFVFLKLIYI